MNGNSNTNVLNVPSVESVTYERNLIDIAVCELRFPTLLELEKKPPVKLQAKLRKKYPHYEIQQRAEFTSTEGIPGQLRYLFRSKSRAWFVTIHAGAISIETSSYTEFEEFYDRLFELLQESKTLIDSDFFTRVGLRYINTVPILDNIFKEWINPHLESNLTEGPYGYLQKYASEIRGFTVVGNYTFRHGIKSIKENTISEYLLDFDYYKEDVQYNEVASLIKDFNKINFSFFNWCIGPKAKKHLGQNISKKKPRKGAAND